MLGFSSFAALLPQFQALWGLNNTDAGWIGGVFFAGYTVAVPALVSLTDRVDPKRIYLSCAALTAIAGLGFAVSAEGFWTAVLFRGLAGIGLAVAGIHGVLLWTAIMVVMSPAWKPPAHQNGCPSLSKSR